MDDCFIRVSENISSSYTHNYFVCFDVATGIYYSNFGEQNTAERGMTSYMLTILPQTLWLIPIASCYHP